MFIEYDSNLGWMDGNIISSSLNETDKIRSWLYQVRQLLNNGSNYLKNLISIIEQKKKSPSRRFCDVANYVPRH